MHTLMHMAADTDKCNFKKRGAFGLIINDTYINIYFNQSNMNDTPIFQQVDTKSLKVVTLNIHM